MKLPAGQAARLVLRVSADAPVDLVVSAGGREAGTVLVEGDDGWVERALALPAESGTGETAITVTAQARGDGEARFGAFHYWVYAGG